MPLDDHDLLAANASFYAAFARADLEALAELWGEASPVACVHPGWELLKGRERVLQSFRAILSGGAPPLTFSAAEAHLLGDAGFVTCLEHLPSSTLVATNVFAREGDRFRLVHHQATPIARAIPQPAPSGGLKN